MRDGLRRVTVGAGMGVLWLAVTGVAAYGQAAPEVERESDSATVPVLFESNEPLTLRIETDLRSLVQERDSLKLEEHDATLIYPDADGTPVTVDLKVRARGHWRRQRRNCDFPPVRLNFPQSRVGGTVFAGQDKLKLVTSCRPGRGDYDEYVLREYLPYRIYNLLTPRSLRVRLATTTFVDERGQTDSVTMETFLIEDADQMAARNGGLLLEARGARFEDVDSLQLGLVALFLYMIGGTDWSLSGLHNIELVQVPDAMSYFPVTYDFDWTGIVDTKYTFPDHRLPIRTVRERLYRGPCLSETHWNGVLAVFAEQQPAIYALYDSLPGLSERYVRDTRRYLDDFYEVINDFEKMWDELLNRCRTAEGF